VECVLSLQDWYLGTFHEEATPPRSAQDYPPPAKQATGFTPLASQIVGQYSPGSSHSDGLAFLMQSCTHLLKTRMGAPVSPPPSTPPTATIQPEIALDAVGPVLETVLANLTSEYERRLLAKDHELKVQLDKARNLQQKLDEVDAELAGLRDLHRELREHQQATPFVDNSIELQLKEECDRLKASERALLHECSVLQDTIHGLTSTKHDQEDTIKSLKTEILELKSQYDDVNSSYKNIYEENKDLYNQLQDARGAIRVFCRVRPVGTTGDNSSSIVEVDDEENIAVYSHKHSKWHQFKFDRVFRENSTQEEVYRETKPLVRSVLDGFNVCIFAYGQTGSGKTYTMSGPGLTIGSAYGINYRALNDLFSQRDERSDEVQFQIKVRLLEIYNETIRDLLSTENSTSGRGLRLMATKGSGENVVDATLVTVSSANEVAKIMHQGAANRTVAGTRLNDASSRSHLVLTVMVEGRVLGSGDRTNGCLHLIDLAGSERILRSGATGQQLTEAQNINKSLSALGNVMQALAQKRDHIPFRDSKLTQLLADSLSGQAKSMMFVHIAPESSSASETLSTLNFGSSVTRITLGEAKRNVESGSSWQAKEMKERLAQVERELEEEKAARLQVSVELEEAQRKLQGSEQVEIQAYRPPLSVASKEEFEPTMPSGLRRPSVMGPLEGEKSSEVGSRGSESPGNLTPLSGHHLHRESKIPTPLGLGLGGKQGSLRSKDEGADAPAGTARSKQSASSALSMRRWCS
jgi:hypothetical protein